MGSTGDKFAILQELVHGQRSPSSIIRQAAAHGISRGAVHYLPRPTTAGDRMAALCPQPGTSRRHRAHQGFSDLLRHRTITRPTEVWAMDATSVPMEHGSVYLAAVLAWASRRALGWRVSITLDSAFRIAAEEDAIARNTRCYFCGAADGACFWVSGSA